MNETGYDLVAHKHYRKRVINIMRIRTGYKYFAKRDRKLKRNICSDRTLLDRAQALCVPLALDSGPASLSLRHCDKLSSNSSLLINI